MIVIQQMADDQYRKKLRVTLGDERYRMAVTEQLLEDFHNDIYNSAISSTRNRMPSTNG